jgi:hypothetical protein
MDAAGPGSTRCGSFSLLTRVTGDGEEARRPGTTGGGGAAMRGETAREAMRGETARRGGAEQRRRVRAVARRRDGRCGAAAVVRAGVVV